MEKERKEKEQKKQNASAGRLKWLAGWLSLLAGTVLAVYVGIWRMLIKPLMELYLAYKMGQLYLTLVLITALKCWLSLTVTGAIWIVGYMGKSMLEEPA